MKLIRRLLVCFSLMPAAYAGATQWTALSSASDLSYAVDSDSIVTTQQGYIEYVAKTTWKQPAKLSGAAQPVAVSITHYQLDCDRKQWRALDTRYLSASGAPAGSMQPASAAWSAIGPGTVVDLMFKKVC